MNSVSAERFDYPMYCLCRSYDCQSVVLKFVGIYKIVILSYWAVWSQDSQSVMLNIVVSLIPRLSPQFGCYVCTRKFEKAPDYGTIKTNRAERLVALNHVWTQPTS